MDWIYSQAMYATTQLSSMQLIGFFLHAKYFSPIKIIKLGEEKNSPYPHLVSTIEQCLHSIFLSTLYIHP
jgi:hypothetical protein